MIFQFFFRQGIENEDKMSTHQVKIRDSERERLGDQYTIDS